MQRLRLLFGASLLTLCACTPEIERLQAWHDEQTVAATEAGLPCPEYAADLAWRALPLHFLYVIERESRCDPTAVNDSSGALGLTQVMPSWLRNLCPLDIACTRDDLLRPTTNLDAAAVIYAVQGPDAWVTW